MPSLEEIGMVGTERPVADSVPTVAVPAEAMVELSKADVGESGGVSVGPSGRKAQYFEGGDSYVFVPDYRFRDGFDGDFRFVRLRCGREFEGGRLVMD